MAGDRERSDEELARTATAPGSSEPLPSDAAPLGEQLGRYKIQKELGRGGMGVVHAAFDPDLERRVALKVLRASGEGGEARQRLLREARAMARVTHSNVVTVHEVGSASGRDFIAMELVDGETLEDWLLAKPRTEQEIIDAFVAAGRGLAAAHAAGLVHRDFKPRNVLVNKDGRIVVTDFGLVVGVEMQADAFKITQPVDSNATETTTPSSLSGLTKTGSVLGTPAYMAPEQWTGGTIGPPADQFAFCVALWEALTKERPYTGTTLDALKAQVTTGQCGDDAKLPRRLRNVLRRGLDPDPAKRYPTMDALLAAITRGERRRSNLAMIIGASAVVAAAVIFVVASGRTSTKTSSTPVTANCRSPVLDPAKVWVARDGQLLRDARQALAAEAFERDAAAWTAARAKACEAPAATQEAALSCLDGVLTRFDALKRATLAGKGDDNVEVGADLIDPAVCLAARPPRLTRTDLFEVFVAERTHLRVGSAFEKVAQDALLAKTAKEPCASALAHVLVAGEHRGPEGRRLVDEAERASQSCGDDRIAVEIATHRALTAIQIASPTAMQELAKVEALVARVAQPDLQARLEQYRAANEMPQDQVDSAIERMARAADLYTERGLFKAALNARIRALDFRRLRARPDDLTAIEPGIRAIRAQARTKLSEEDWFVRAIDTRLAEWMWRTGDIAGADALREKSRIPTAVEEPRDVTGRVVDEAGAPVANAEVAAASFLFGDSLHAAIPSNSLVRSVTRADGTFTLRGVEKDAICVAQLGERRSRAAHISDDVTLKLLPTSRITGKVDLKGRPPQIVTVTVLDPSVLTLSYGVSAPVMADGSFVVDGAPRGRVRIDVSVSQHVSAQTSAGKDIVVTTPVVENVQVAAPQGRAVYVLVRSMYGVEMSLSQVFVLAGKRPTDTNVAALLPGMQNLASRFATPIGEQNVPEDVRAMSKPGDLYAKIADAPDGDASACTIPLPVQFDDPKVSAILSDPRTYEKIPVRCTPVKRGDKIVVALVPPWPRFD